MALCAGASGLELGISLAAEFLGIEHRTVCYVEREAYAATCLVARMADASLEPAPVWDDVKSFEGRPWRGLVSLLTAGYPCQPFSNAGKRLGKKDPRHLWPDVARIIEEVGPPLVFLENVSAHLRKGAREVVKDLHRMGYETAIDVRQAAEAGAPHRRERLFILGHADGERPRRTGRTGAAPKKQRDAGNAGLGLADAGGNGRTGRAQLGRTLQTGLFPHATHESVAQYDRPWMGELPLWPPGRGEADLHRWAAIVAERPEIKPAVHRMAYGMAPTLDRLRLTGNGVVPIQAALAFLTCLSALAGRVR